jgi:hypothetical protein
MFLVAGIVAAGCAAPMDANAQSCPRGQIFRVSMGVCQPKSADNARWSGERGTSARDRGAMKPSSARPAVGDVVLFGSTFPTLLKPDAPKSAPKTAVKRVATTPPPKQAHPKLQTRAAVAKAAPPAPKESVAAVARAAVAPTPVVPLSMPAPHSEPRVRVEEPTREVAVAAPEPKRVTPPAQPEPAVTAPEPAPIEAAQTPQVEAQPEEARNEAPAVEESAPEPPRDQRTAALEERAETPAPAQAPPEQVPAVQVPPAQVPPAQVPLAPVAAAPEAPVSTPDDTMTTASIEPRNPVRTAPLAPSPEAASPPAQADSGLPDWGDEKKLVEALRENWKSKPVARTFQRGDEVPADIELQPLPAPFASRAAGVNMHYLMSNGDAVLVLPGMRVVVDVYHSTTASR